MPTAPRRPMPARWARGLLPLGLAVASLTSCAVTPPPAAGPRASASASASNPSRATAGAATTPQTQTLLALITDFGTCDADEEWAAKTVHSWNVEAIITGGDNTQNPVAGSCVPYERSLWGFFGRRADGRGTPDMWPTLGNHDYTDPGAGLDAYRRAFPYLSSVADSQQRWYSQALGNVRLFVVDSEVESASEMEGQRLWLKDSLRSSRADSPSIWNVVVLHRGPYTSGVHGPNTPLRPIPDGRWNYKEWGADLVVSGHQHIYEDVLVDGMHYLTAGISAGDVDRECPAVRTVGSRLCLSGPGAIRLLATRDSLILEYHQRAPAGGSQVTDTLRLVR